MLVSSLLVWTAVILPAVLAQPIVNKGYTPSSPLYRRQLCSQVVCHNDAECHFGTCERCDFYSNGKKKGKRQEAGRCHDSDEGQDAAKNQVDIKTFGKDGINNIQTGPKDTTGKGNTNKYTLSKWAPWQYNVFGANKWTTAGFCALGVKKELCALRSGCKSQGGGSYLC